MKPTIINKIIIFCGAFFCFEPSAQAKIVLSEHIALYDEAKYTPDFKSFSYANPYAPKGGRIVMPDYGGFDSFNPFIFKGISPATAVGLTLDTLAVSPVDDPAVAYPLIAKKFELVAPKSLPISSSRSIVIVIPYRSP